MNHIDNIEFFAFINKREFLDEDNYAQRKQSENIKNKLLKKRKRE